MPRRNHTKRKPMRHRYATPGEVPRWARSNSTTRMETMVLPDGKCGRKLRYATADSARAALVEAKKSRQNQNGGKTETRFYGKGSGDSEGPCERCNGYHLTSREVAPQ